jgi:drug/metabolite transporter (DMT)-like permease
VVASVVAMAFFGEVLTLSFVLGGVVVLAGVLITEW